MTRIIVPAMLAMAAANTISAQEPAVAPSFEVASVKPSERATLGTFRMVARQNEPGRIHYTMMSLHDLIRTAYQVKDYQISGPSWMDTERFDVTATFPPDTPKDRIPLMMQTLLAERFKLEVHREKKELPAYGLVVAKNGPKFKESEAKDDPPPASGPNTFAGGGGVMSFSVNGSGKLDTEKLAKAIGGRGMMMMPGHTIAKQTTMTTLVDMLSRMMDRPVVDETGLTAKYDFNLEFAPEPGQGTPFGKLGPGDGAPGHEVQLADPSAPPLPVALQQQLGLKLEPKKLPADMVIVDRAEKIPTEN